MARRGTGVCKAFAFEASFPLLRLDGEPPPRVFTSTLLPSPFLMSLPEQDLVTGWRPNVVLHLIGLEGLWAPVETQIFYALLSPAAVSRGKLVVDVGVNVGWFSLVSLALGYRVVGFDANRALVPQVAASVQLNAGFGERFDFLPCGVGDALTATAPFTPSIDPTYSGLGAVKGVGVRAEDTSAVSTVVALVALADVINEDVVVLKVDTEGYEATVFSGAWSLFDRHTIEHVIVEIKSTENRIDIQRQFKERGYSCHMYDETWPPYKGAPIKLGGAETAQGLLLPCDPIGGGAFEDFIFSLHPL